MTQQGFTFPGSYSCISETVSQDDVLQSLLTNSEVLDAAWGNHQEIRAHQEDVWTRQKPNKEKWMACHWPLSLCLPERVLHPSAGWRLFYTVRAEKCDVHWSRTPISLCCHAFLWHQRSRLCERNSTASDSALIHRLDSDIGYQM